MKKFSLLFVCIAVALNICALNVFADESKDSNPPVISVKEEDIFILEGDKLDIKDYIDVEDESPCQVSTLGKYDTREPGNYSATVYAVDNQGNVSALDIKFRVVNLADFEKLEAARIAAEKEAQRIEQERKFQIVYNPSEKNADLEIIKGTGTVTDAYGLAQQFIGMPGSCNVVAQAFVDAYYGPGHSIYNYYEVSESEAQPGDVIYYYNGGLNLQHWAVYLGGGYALQGNYLGTTIIGGVYLNNASNPLFLRLY